MALKTKLITKTQGREKTNLEEVTSEFKRRFKKAAKLLIRSPGRVNIIGEHSDYHDGYVMPAAIDLGIDWALGKNNQNKIRGYSLNIKENGEFKVSGGKRVEKQWLQYLQGVIEILKEDGKKIGGIDLVIKGNLPIGSGLSSSSSLATGFAFAVSKLYALALSKKELTDIGCRAEWWFGTRGGNMDQFAISHGRKGKVIFFDPRNFEFEYVSFPRKVSIVIFETTVRHNQRTTPFSKRREQAERGLKMAQKRFPQKKIKKLRDLNSSLLESIRHNLSGVVYRRCLHAITERARVLSSKEAFKKGDLGKIRENMIASHQSLDKNYEVTCQELNIAFEEAYNCPGVIAARMCGGGFGGGTINLVQEDRVKDFSKELKKRFIKRTGLSPETYITKPADGVKII